MRCRHCNSLLTLEMVNLGESAPSNAYLTSLEHVATEHTFPLRVWVCEACWLVQTDDKVEADKLFTSNYAYLSSTSKSWLLHARRYCDEVIDKCALSAMSFVVELAANDGYLLKNFADLNIPCLGVEPTKATADIARSKGIPILEAFFGEQLAMDIVTENRKADLVIANNVLAHVPNINDFVTGCKLLLAENGTITFEFPSLLNLIKFNQFDTIYHEHYSYLNLTVVERILTTVGLKVYDVEELPSHGGSLRVWATHTESTLQVTDKVMFVKQKENEFGLFSKYVYQDFAGEVAAICSELRAFLIAAKQAGRNVVAYGAAAKGNTLLNTAGIKKELLPVVFDAAPSKQGCFLPGSHIPIDIPDNINSYEPDIVLILPWNLTEEIMISLKQVVPEACQFVTAIPRLTFR